MVLEVDDFVSSGSGPAASSGRPVAAGAAEPPLTVTVRPLSVGWRLRGAALGEPLYFLSGREAELQGRRVCERLARNGHEARLLVHDRSGRIAGEVRFCDLGRAARGQGSAATSRCP